MAADLNKYTEEQEIINWSLRNKRKEKHEHLIEKVNEVGFESYTYLNQSLALISK